MQSTPLATLLFVTIAISTNIATIISAVNIQRLICRGGRTRAVGFGNCNTSYLSQQRALLFVSTSAIFTSNINKQRRCNTPIMDKSATQSDSAEATTTDAIKLLRQQKQSLRKKIRSRIKTSYPPTEIEKLSTKSNEVFSRLLALPEYQSAKSVGFFLSMPSGEIQTRNAIRQIVNDGKVLFVPRVGLDFDQCDMDMVRCNTAEGGGNDSTSDGSLFYDSWPRNKWGIPEPPVTSVNVAKPGDIDLLIVPGLAFDTHGHRLGQGKGYYDRFIAKMRDDDDSGGANDTKKPILVGVCLEEQFLDEVPHGVDLDMRDDSSGGIIPVSDHDYIMDMVLTPSQTLIVPK